MVGNLWSLSLDSLVCINYEVNTQAQIQKEQKKMFVQIILQALILHYQFKNLAKISYKHTKTYLMPFIFKSPYIELALLNCTKSTVLYVCLIVEPTRVPAANVKGISDIMKNCLITEGKNTKCWKKKGI